ncbi:hypothetical protein GYM54_19055 [Pseudomonas sp. MTM4]|nr:hypothetical protein [Stutzerimonas stutzeri]MBC8650420.1 hypothetical protein [Pseudomonas sp. MT4]QXY90093.1 hypothetical protein GYM54_19055 [Pseudomonas sp. MTM4]TCD19974.1 hypothetical protein E0D86_16170 [Pseudomonas sp. IC_126]
MQENAESDLIYGLDDRPAPTPAIFAARQHILASFAGIVTRWRRSYCCTSGANPPSSPARSGLEPMRWRTDVNALFG